MSNKSKILLAHANGEKRRKIAADLSVSVSYVSQILRENRIHGKPGRPTAFSADQEQILVEFLGTFQKNCIQVTRPFLRQVLRAYAEKNELVADYGQEGFSEKWLSGFLLRNRNSLSEKMPYLYLPAKNGVHPDSGPADQFWTVVQRIFTRMAPKGILSDLRASQIFVFREMNVSQEGRAVRETPPKSATGNSRDRSSCLCCMSASGSILCPTVLFEGKLVGSKQWAQELPEDRRKSVRFLAGDSSWNSSVTFLKWLQNIFAPQVTNFPVVIFLSHHNTHLASADVALWCIERKVYLAWFPSDSDSDTIPTPLDECFESFKTNLKTSFRDMQKDVDAVTKGHIVAAVTKAFDASFCPEAIRVGFAVARVWPFEGHLDFEPEGSSESSMDSVGTESSRTSESEDELSEEVDGMNDEEMSVQQEDVDRLMELIPVRLGMPAIQDTTSLCANLPMTAGRSDDEVEERFDKIMSVLRGKTLLQRALTEKLEVLVQLGEGISRNSRQMLLATGFILNEDIIGEHKRYAERDLILIDRIQAELMMEDLVETCSSSAKPMVLDRESVDSSSVVAPVL